MKMPYHLEVLSARIFQIVTIKGFQMLKEVRTEYQITEKFQSP